MAGNYSLGTAVGRIVVDGAGAELGFGIAKQAGSEFFDAVQSQLESLKDFGQNMMKAGAVGAGGFVLAGNAAANYEQRLSAVKAVSGASEEQMKQISDAALKIGADTSFSATEAANAFEELVKAGISVQDALDGAALATANLAAAGEIALPRAAEIAANAMNNFNLKGKDMPRIADLVAGAANASAISVEEFAQSLSQVGAVANLAGISFDDTAVAIAEMGNAGIKGSDAGTSLKTMLMNLQPVTNAQQVEFEKLGLMAYSAEKSFKILAKDGIRPLGNSLDDARAAVEKHLVATGKYKEGTKAVTKATDEYLIKNGAYQNAFFTAKGKVKGLSDMQDVLQKATKGMTQEQKLASLEILFGSDAIRAAAIMAKEGKKGFDDLSGAMGKVTAADVAATRLDNVKGSIEKLKGSFETLMIQMGMIFLPVVKKVVDGITEFVNWLTSATERTKTFIVSLGAIGTGFMLVAGGLITAVAALAPFIAHMVGLALIKKSIWGVISAVKFVGTAFATSTGPISFMVKIFGGLRGIFFGVAGAARTAGTAVGLFGRIAGVALNLLPFFKIAMLIVTAGVILYNTWEPFRVLVDNIAGIIGGALSVAMQALQKVIGDVVNGFNGVSGAGDGISVFFNNLGRVAAAVWADMQKLGEIFMQTVVPALQELWGVLQSSFGDALGQIGRVVQSDLLPALQQMSDVFINQVFPALQQVGSFLLPIIGFVLQVVGALVGFLYVALIKVVSFIIGTVLPALIQFAGPVLGFLIAAIATVAGFIIQFLIVPFINFVTFLFGTVIPAIVSFGSMIVGAIGTAIGFIGDVIGNVVGFIGDVINSIVGFFSGMGGAASEGSSGIQNAFAGIASFFAPIVDAVVGFVSGIVTAVVTGFTAVANFLAPAMNLIGEIVSAVWGVIWAIISGVTGLIVALVNYAWQFIVFAITTALNVIWTSIMTVWNAILAFIVPIITTIWNFIVMVFTAIWSFIVTVLTTIWNVYVAIWTAIITTVVNAVTTIWNFIVSVWNTIVGFITGVLTNIWNFFVSVWNNIVAAVSGPLNAIWAVVMSIWNAIVGFITGVVNGIVGTVRGAFERAVSTVTSVWGGLMRGIENGWKAVGDFFGGIGDNILRSIGNLGDLLVGAGKSIIDGFLSGLRGMAGDIDAFFKGITDKIPKIKGPASYDKVMLIPAGKMIMQSLLKGFEGEEDSVLGFLGGLNAKIPATIDAALDPSLKARISAQLSGKSTFSTLNQAPVVNVAPAQVTANFNAKVFMGDRDITDIVDVRIDEKMEEAAGLIQTGVY